MELKFTPLAVKRLEDNTGKVFYDLMSSPSVSVCFEFVKAGLNVDDDGADKAIGEYLKGEGNDITTLFMAITEALQRDGFLPKSLNVKKLMEQAKKVKK